MKEKRQSWIVKMKREVTTEVIVDGCTEQQAKDNPWAYAIQERDLDQHDWEVLSVKANE